jgi:hypothetical protein
VSGTQTTGACSSGYYTYMVRYMNEIEAHEGISPQKVTSWKKKPRWFQETLKEDKNYVGEPQKLMRERRAPKRFSSYLAMVTSIKNSDPTNFEQATDQQVWRDAMQKKYDSIMQNDVCVSIWFTFTNH